MTPTLPTDKHRLIPTWWLRKNALPGDGLKAVKDDPNAKWHPSMRRGKTLKGYHITAYHYCTAEPIDFGQEERKACPWHSIYIEGCAACETANAAPRSGVGEITEPPLEKDSGPITTFGEIRLPNHSNTDSPAPSASEVPTPRTDEQAEQLSNLPAYLGPIEWKLFARQLERETIALRQQVEDAKKLWREQCDAVNHIAHNYEELEQQLAEQAKRREAEAEAERDTYKDGFESAKRSLDAATQRNREVEAIEKAPHGRFCMSGGVGGNPCTCWKNAALSRALTSPAVGAEPQLPTSGDIKDLHKEFNPPSPDAKEGA
jgi:hypothetical protein